MSSSLSREAGLPDSFATGRHLARIYSLALGFIALLVIAEFGVVRMVELQVGRAPVALEATSRQIVAAERASALLVRAAERQDRDRLSRELRALADDLSRLEPLAAPPPPGALLAALSHPPVSGSEDREAAAAIARATAGLRDVASSVARGAAIPAPDLAARAVRESLLPALEARHVAQTRAAGEVLRWSVETEAALRLILLLGIAAVGFIVMRPTIQLVVDRSRALSEAHDALQHAAFHDAVTGLANADCLGFQLEALMADPGLDNQILGFVAVEVEGMEGTLERHGSAAADDLLRDVAARLRAVVSDEDLLARMGSRDFLLVRADVLDEEELLVFADKIARRLASPAAIDGKLAAPQPRVVAAPLVAGAITPQEALSDVRRALAFSRHERHGAPMLLTGARRTRMQRSAKIAAALGEAVRSGGVIPLFRPVLDLTTGTLAAVELRLGPIDLGGLHLGAEELLAEAEMHGHAAALSSALWRAGFSAMADWRRAGRVRVPPILPLTAEGFIAEGAIDRIAAAAEEAGFGAGEIVVRIDGGIPEKAAEVAALRRAAHACRSAGLIFAFSSASALPMALEYGKETAVPVRIGPAMLSALTGDPAPDRQIAALRTYAAALGRPAFADGVDDRGLLELVWRMRLELAAGDAICPPLPGEAFLAWVEKRFRHRAAAQGLLDAG